MMVELWTRKREIGDEDVNDMEDTSSYEQSGVGLAWLGLEELVLLVLPTGLRLVPAVSGMVNWLPHNHLLTHSFSRWFPPSPLIFLFLVLNSTITQGHEVKSSLSISSCHNHELTLSTAYTKYSIIPSSTVSCSQPVFHLSADVVVLNSLHSHNYKLTNE